VAVGIGVGVSVFVALGAGVGVSVSVAVGCAVTEAAGTLVAVAGVVDVDAGGGSVSVGAAVAAPAVGVASLLWTQAARVNVTCGVCPANEQPASSKPVTIKAPNAARAAEKDLECLGCSVSIGSLEVDLSA
jgi:hypothetical protein